MAIRVDLQHRSAPTHAQSGFSLIELMVVVSLLAILAGLAAPSFTGLFERFRVETARDNLVTTIQLARTEAIRRAQQVTIRRKTDCPNNDWSCGWRVFVDANNNGTQDAGEPTYRETEAMRGVFLTKNGTADWFSIDTFGQSADFAAFSFRIGPQGNSTSERCIRVASSVGFRFSSITGKDECPS